MHATEMNKIVGQALIDAGFRGVIPVDQARKIVSEVKTRYSSSGFKITVEMSPVHNVGKTIRCDCARSTIKVEQNR